MRTPTPSTKALAWITGLALVGACTLEVNVNLDGHDDDVSVETRFETSAAPTAAPSEADAPLPPSEVEPSPNTWTPKAPSTFPPLTEGRLIPPPHIDPPLIPEVSEAIRDALLRPQAPEPSPEAPPQVDDRDLRREPAFTPFTDAPSILNRQEVVEAMIEAYPPPLREAGIGGTVRVYFFIEDDGTVGNVRIDQGSGNEGLDRAALDVAHVYRFTPAKNHTVNVPVWVSFPVTFQVR